MSPSVSTAFPLIVRVEDLETGTSSEHVFRRSPVRVGRNALNELTLQSPFVSLSHAVLRFDAERTEVIDLGSTNGVLVEGKRVEANVPVPVTPQSDVRIGSLRFHFGRGPSAAAPPAREQTQFRRATEEIRLTPAPHGIRLPPELRSPAPRTSLSPAAGTFTLASPEASPAGPTVAPSAPTPMRAGAGAPGAKVEVLNLSGSPAAAGAEAALAPRDAELKAAVDLVFPLYVEYRQSWRRVHDTILSKSNGLGRAERLQLASLLDARMPALYQEEQFRAFTGMPPEAPDSSPTELEVQAAPTAAAVVPPSAEQRSLLQVFARTYAGGTEVTSDAELERLLERVSEVLEAFGTAFLELRKGQAEFGEGIAVRTVTADTPLRRARSPQELLRWLLDPAADGGARIDDLTGGFGEVMIHQVAMLGATRRGIRALLDRLDPKKLQSPLRWPARLWLRWQRFESAWNALAEEERAVQVVFGPEFARSYAMVMGGHGATATGSGGVPGRISGKTSKPRGEPP